MTEAEKAVQTALYELWYENYTRTMTQTKRNQLVSDFAEKWLDPSKIKVDKPGYYHPMTRLKQRYDRPPVTVMEILADFVLRADMHAERSAEYPVTHDEQEITLVDRRRAHEIGLFTDEIDEEAGERVPYGVITEAEAQSQSYTPAEPITVEKLTKELAHVKKHAEFYATSFSEEYGFEREDALRRIKGLRLESVKECVICANAFYTRNIRRNVCDQQHGIKAGGGKSELSACEIIYQSSYQRNYYKNSSKSS